MSQANLAVEFDFEFPAKPKPLSIDQKAEYKARIKQLLIEKNAVLVAHYYTDPEIQALAEETGGCVADSLEMARFGNTHPADTLIVAGVKFMGETAKVLTPEKTVIMPTLEATCSLDLGCPIKEFNEFCDQHPDRTVVVYANTSTAVKARADWIVTSSCALEIVEHLDSRIGRLIEELERKPTGIFPLRVNDPCSVFRVQLRAVQFCREHLPRGFSNRKNLMIAETNDLTYLKLCRIHIGWLGGDARFG